MILHSVARAAALTLLFAVACDAQGKVVYEPVCKAQYDACAASVNGVNRVAVADWTRSLETHLRQREMCMNQLKHCFNGDETCHTYQRCVPYATLCQQKGVVKAYGTLGTSACEGYIQCVKENTYSMCVYHYANVMFVPHPDGSSQCDFGSICATDQREVAGCEVRTEAQCHDDSDCEFHAPSRACWEAPADKRTFETLTISLMFAFYILLCLWMGYYIKTIAPQAGYDNNNTTKRQRQHDVYMNATREQA